MSQPFQLHPSEVRDFSNLDLLARQVVEGFIIGLHKSPYHGFSVEFAEHRLFNAGESTRNIDWKVYGRTDKLFVKRFEEETNLRCQIVMDTSSSMYFPYKDKKHLGYNKIQWSSLAAASLMNLLRKQRDAFGLTMFDREVHTHTPCKSATSHYHLLINHLERLLAREDIQHPTSAASALHQIAESIHKRSLVVVFSDMMEPGKEHEELFSALRHLKYNKHEVILFHVVDHKHEVNFEFENRPYLFVDMETGEQVRLQSNQVREFYMQQMATFREKLRYRCLQYHIDFVEADINEGFRPVLQQFLVKRSKMR